MNNNFIFTNEDFIIQYVHMFFTSQQLVSKSIYEMESKITDIKKESNKKRDSFIDYRDDILQTYHSLYTFYQQLSNQTTKFITDINEIHKQNKKLKTNENYNNLIKDFNCVIQAIIVNKTRIEKLLKEIKQFISKTTVQKIVYPFIQPHIETLSTDSDISY